MTLQSRRAQMSGDKVFTMTMREAVEKVELRRDWRAKQVPYPADVVAGLNEALAVLKEMKDEG